MAYVVYVQGQQEGPFEESEILERLEAGILSSSDLIWDDGSQSWLEIGQVLVFHPPEGVAPAPNPEPVPPPADAVPEAKSVPGETPQRPVEPWVAFCTDKQKRSVVKRVHPLAAELCMLDEDILYMAVQRKPLLFYSPECLVLTNKRLFIFFKRLLKMDYYEFRWEEVLNLHFKEGLMGSHLTFKAGTGQAYGIYYLPKKQGRKAMHLATEHHEAARERFRKTHVPGFAPAPTAARPPAQAPIPARTEDPQAQLTKLKKLLDDQLISQEDYDKKKAEILSRL